MLEAPINLDIGCVVLVVFRVLVDVESIVGLKHQVGVEVVLEGEAVLAMSFVPGLGVAQDVVVEKVNRG